MAPLNTGDKLWLNLQNLLATPSTEDPSGIFTASELVKLRMVYHGETYERDNHLQSGKTGDRKK